MFATPGVTSSSTVASPRTWILSRAPFVLDPLQFLAPKTPEAELEGVPDDRLPDGVGVRGKLVADRRADEVRAMRVKFLAHQRSMWPRSTNPRLIVIFSLSLCRSLSLWNLARHSSIPLPIPYGWYVDGMNKIRQRYRFGGPVRDRDEISSRRAGPSPGGPSPGSTTSCRTPRGAHDRPLTDVLTAAASPQQDRSVGEVVSDLARRPTFSGAGTQWCRAAAALTMRGTSCPAQRLDVPAGRKRPDRAHRSRPRRP